MKIKLSFDIHDAWIGFYFKDPWYENGKFWYRFYVCILPFLPIQITWTFDTWGER